MLELALGGELFDFVAISGRFEEDLARYYFKQFLEGLDYCHMKGVAHRDLKPENLLLDQHFTLKIADFGFAAPLEGRDGSGQLTTKLGTLNYMAPEIHLKQPYQGKSVDIFAAAIILFIMVAQHPPFNTAQPNDPFYRCLAASRADIFWKTHCKTKPGGEAFFSEDFKDLVQGMLQLDPSHRPSINEVLSHPWMQGPMPTQEEVVQEFTKRDIAVKKQSEMERQQKEKEKQRLVQRKRNEANRGDNTNEYEKPSKPLRPYEKIFATNTEFFSTYNPDLIEDTICESLQQQNIEPKVSKDKYKIKFTMTTKDQGGESHQTDMCVNIL